MQTLYVNIVLSILCISLIVKHYLIPIYTKYKKDRERQRVTRSNKEKEYIKEVVREYLQELRNDD